MSPRRLAIVPARGGSKRVPDKNIRDFAGRPMIAYILDTARRSELFDAIHVSTESARIAAVVEKLGFKIDFPRPAALATDDMPLMPVLRHVTETYVGLGQDFDEIWLLMACAPLVEFDELQGAARLFAEHSGQYAVLGVSAYPTPPEWAYERREDGRLVPVQPGKFALRSQDLGIKYYDTGSFCAFPVQRILQSVGAGDDSAFVGFVLPRHKGIDIDTEGDWRLAEMIFAAIHKPREKDAE